MRIPFTHKEVSLGQLFSKYIFPLTAATIVEATALGPWRRAGNGSIVLFGHDLNGNLAAFAGYLAALPDAPRVLFMTDSAETYRRDRAVGRDILYSAKLGHLFAAARADAIVTSHGPINLFRWPKRRHRPLFVDVWHGVGYKTDPKTIASMTSYDGHFVASPMMTELHVKFGLPRELMTETGYGRTEALATLELARAARAGVLAGYGLDPAEKRSLVLYAPTWNHHEPLDIFPFGMTPQQFLAPLDALAAEIGALVLVRLHLNTVLDFDTDAFAHVALVPARLYPATEPLLTVADVLVTDWSSIVSEYLTVRRPIVFIDKPTPFSGPVQPLSRDDRPGSIVSGFDELAEALELAVTRPADYLARHAEQVERTTRRAWGGSLDGRSAERYLQQIDRLRGRG